MEPFSAILINIVVPLAGLKTFLWLRDRMRIRKIERPPVIPLFIILATYGGFLMVVLTDLFWRWSGMASLGTAYLMLIAPIMMIVLAVFLYRDRQLSRYHLGSFIASVIYPCLVIPTVVLYWIRFH